MERTIRNSEDLKDLYFHLGNMKQPFRIRASLGADRSLAQNALLHKWYGEIALHEGDTAHNVKGRCHREHALNIRLRDPQFSWVWDQTGRMMPYEKQCAILASGVLSISSAMTTAELKEYLDSIEADYRLQRGIALTIPPDERSAA